MHIGDTHPGFDVVTLDFSEVCPPGSGGSSQHCDREGAGGALHAEGPEL